MGGELIGRRGPNTELAGFRRTGTNRGWHKLPMNKEGREISGISGNEPASRFTPVGLRTLFTGSRYSLPNRGTGPQSPPRELRKKPRRMACRRVFPLDVAAKHR
jgi:hypothetical protein